MDYRCLAAALTLAASVLTCAAGVAAHHTAGGDTPPLRKVKPRLVLDNRFVTAVRSVRFSPDTKLIAAGGDSTSLNVWEVGTGRVVLRAIDLNDDDLLDQHEMLAFTPDGKTLIAGGADAIRCWDIGKGKMTGTIDACGCGMALSPDGKTLAAPIISNGVLLYDIASRKIRATLNVPAKEGTTCAAFSPDGKFVAVGDGSGRVHVRPAAGRGRAPLPPMIHAGDDRYPKMVTSVSYSRDGKILASTAHDWHVNLWDAASGKSLHRFRGEYCAFTKDGRHLFVPDDGGLKIWEVASGNLREELDFPDVTSMAVSPDGKILVIGMGNGSIRLYDVQALLAGPKPR